MDTHVTNATRSSPSTELVTSALVRQSAEIENAAPTATGHGVNIKDWGQFKDSCSRSWAGAQ
jgi:hypothetical protein